MKLKTGSSAFSQTSIASKLFMAPTVFGLSYKTTIVIINTVILLVIVVHYLPKVTLAMS